MLVRSVRTSPASWLRTWNLKQSSKDVRAIIDCFTEEGRLSFPLFLFFQWTRF